MKWFPPPQLRMLQQTHPAPTKHLIQNESSDDAEYKIRKQKKEGLQNNPAGEQMNSE